MVLKKAVALCSTSTFCTLPSSSHTFLNVHSCTTVSCMKGCHFRGSPQYTVVDNYCECQG